MRILFISSPLTHGLLMREEPIIRALASLGTVDIIWRQTGSEISIPDQWHALAQHVWIQPDRMGYGLEQPRVAAGLFSRLFWKKGVHHSLATEQCLPEVRSALEDDYDLIWVTLLLNAKRLPVPHPSRAILDVSDSRLGAIRRSIKGAGVLTRLQGWLRYAASKKMERAAASAFGRMVISSATDAAYIHHPNVRVVENTIQFDDAVSFSPGIPGRMIFVGSLDYKPNVKGLLWFVNQVLPLIRGELPEAHLHIVGRNPPTMITQLSGKAGVQVIGEVPEVRSHIEQAAINVVPLLNGSGTRLKILESLGYKTPVVSTTVGAEGLGLVDGRDIVVMDTPESFAQACITLLEDEARRQVLAESGYAKVVERYSWKRAQQQVQEVVKSLTAEQGRR